MTQKELMGVLDIKAEKESQDREIGGNKKKTLWHTNRAISGGQEGMMENDKEVVFVRMKKG